MRVLVLGGYGFFGSRIVTLLSRESGLDVLIAGRRQPEAAALVEKLAPAAASLTALTLDVSAPDFPQRLREMSPQVVIHTCGPFQGQDYRVAEACLEAGCDYIDLADGRDFVTGITALDERARARGVRIISGASSVPGLSGAVVDALAPAFSRLDGIDIAISPGNKTDRGLATVRAILSYGGEAIPGWRDGHPVRVTGWGSMQRHCFEPPVGRRWLSDCDVPDIPLLPTRYPTLRQVRFRAGLELGFLHLGMVLMALLRRLRLLPNLSRLAVPLKRISEWFLPFGSDRGAMSVEVRGLDHQGEPCRRYWELSALNGDGPYVPTLCSVALVKRRLQGQPLEPGAYAAPGGLRLEDILPVSVGLAIRTTLQGEAR